MWEMVQDGNVKCWLDLSEISKKGKLYNWKNSIGCKIGVKYKWLCDEVEERYFVIVDYNKNTNKLTLKWNENKYLINTSVLRKGQCGNIFDKYTSNFKYEIGQTVNGLTIIDRYYKQNKNEQRKWYKYRCEKGHEHEIEECRLKLGQGCSICYNRTVLEGYNDLATTRQHLVQYFSNPDDAKKYTAQSNQKVYLKCPFCGKEKTMRICNLTRQGFSCPNCSDGIVLTEKFMSNLLFFKNIEFIYQATKTNFDWIKDNKSYDFALPTYKTIIEIDGDLRSHGDRTNDDYKDEMAKVNGWNVIRINLLENYTGSFEQLWNAYKYILNDLKIYITNEEAKEYYIKSQTSIFHLIVNIANEHTEFSLQQIADELKEKYGYQLNDGTIGRYMKKSNKIGLTNYKNKDKKSVICVTTGKNYESVIEAERQTGVLNSHICGCCKGKYKSAGVIDGKPAIWMYLDDYEKLSNEEKGTLKKQEFLNVGRPKRTICVTTGEIYESLNEAERQTGINHGSISECCLEKRKYAGKLNGEKLVWMYYEDYLESLK